MSIMTKKLTVSYLNEPDWLFVQERKARLLRLSVLEQADMHVEKLNGERKVAYQLADQASADDFVAFLRKLSGIYRRPIVSIEITDV